MPAETVLIADDEASIRDLTRLYLEKEGYKVVSAANGAEVMEQVRAHEPDLLVLDLMMPGIDGWEVCRRVRTVSDLPIIMLTARDQDIDKIVGLEMGADDYVTKPFNPRELVARVRALLRRASSGKPQSDRPRVIGNVMVDPASREVTIDEQIVNLRAKEFDLLVTLADHVNQVLSRDQLLDLVWGYEFFGQTRTVDVHVAHLREKLDGSDAHIETIWGKGYKLVVQAPDGT